MSLSLDLAGGSALGSPWATLGPGFAFDSSPASAPTIRHRRVSHTLAAYVLIPLLLIQSLPTLPQESVRSRPFALWTGDGIPHPQTPSPFAEGSGRGGSGDGTRMTAEHRSDTFSPSARAVSLRLGGGTPDDVQARGQEEDHAFDD